MMKLKQSLLTGFFSLFPVLGGFATENLPPLLQELDRVVEQAAVFDRRKELRIDTLKAELKKSLAKGKVHSAYFQLYKEYEAFIFDSAMHYVKIHLDFSEKQKNTLWINECKMQLARMYSTFARFPESVELLRSVDTKSLSPERLGAFYNCFAEVYDYWSEDASDEDASRYTALKSLYQDSALHTFKEGTYDYNINHSRKCIEMRDFAQAQALLLPYLDVLNPETRDYAILTSLIANLYDLRGEEEKRKVFLAKSAIADIKASVKENTSIRLLALSLLNDNDLSRSNQYIKKSLEDANFYNARLRNVQIAKILPLIDNAYQMEKEQHHKNLQGAILVIGVLTLFLIGLVFHLRKQMKNLAKTRREAILANEKLRRFNSSLSENIRIKEEYIGKFLYQCSTYIDKLETYRKSLNKTAANGKIETLFQMLKSSRIIEDELKAFYQQFDSTFLSLFPSFVEEFNRLLPEEDRIVPKNDSELSAELRIFALIRLKITDSAQIADFLHYSKTTIYNYRSKYRNKSLIPSDKFEKAVTNIGTAGR
ncbi:MAG: DUF6377 domain-containing protein [Dysgonamonadaceae bacterium]|jgi:hypothetical protein|nr:DUF6377 domain-containing protein [Dysgonamonadaceae bacterium]